MVKASLEFTASFLSMHPNVTVIDMNNYVQMIYA